MSGDSLVDFTVAQVRAPDDVFALLARARQEQLTKPPGSLGRLEEVAAQLAAIQRAERPKVKPRTVLVFAADHGVVAEGVSPYPQEVTGQMVCNFLAGGAAINVLTRQFDASLDVIDVGVAEPIDGVDPSNCVRRSTDNFAIGPAMTAEEASRSIEVGIESANRHIDAGARLLAIGEMGIGNTTAAAAVASVLLGISVEDAVGRGTGADDEMVARKVAAIDRALGRSIDPTPGGVLAELGGFEIGALCGACLAGAARGVPVLIDGFIAGVGAALAVAFASDTRSYLVASHVSAEKGHRAVLDWLRLRPLLDLELRLGEGSGAALALPLLDAAVATHAEMSTFGEAGVSNKGGGS